MPVDRIFADISDEGLHYNIDKLFQSKKTDGLNLNRREI